MMVSTYMKYETMLTPLRHSAELRRLASPYLPEINTRQDSVQILQEVIPALLIKNPMTDAVYRTLTTRLLFRDVEQLVMQLDPHSLAVLVVAYAAFNQEDLAPTVRVALT